MKRDRRGVFLAVDFLNADAISIRAMAVCLAFFLALSSVAARAEVDDEDEPPDFVPGLVARYSSTNGQVAERRERVLSLVSRGSAPDPRLSPGDFRANWNGLLLTQMPGEYQLRVFARGAVRLTLDEEVLIDTVVDGPTWLAAPPVDLNYGYHPLEVAYEPNGADARIGLYWSGPKFALEPVAERWLFHPPRKTPDGLFQQGRTLARALRCAACHGRPVSARPDASLGETRLREMPAALKAPALDKLAGNMSPEWLVGWLSEQVDPQPPDGETSTVRRMPHFGLARDDALAIAAYLLSPVQPLSVAHRQPEGDPEAGKSLFLTVGCLSCHTSDGLGESGLFGGGDLSTIAAKRPAAFFKTWLKSPAELNRDHRMPVFQLTDGERRDLAAYLATLGDDKAILDSGGDLRGEDHIEHGRKLLAQHRCGACHRLPQGAAELPSDKKIALGTDANWQASCAGGEAAGDRPRYRLTQQEEAALRRYLTASVRDETAIGFDGESIIREHNCLACHRRGLEPGISDQVLAVTAKHETLAPLLPALTPPALNSAGDKLNVAALKAVITGREPARRPWLRVRMPTFRLTEEEVGAVINHLVDEDRIPDFPDDAHPETSAEVLSIAGRRLVTADGFGCTSCHQVGQVKPVKVELNAVGPNLSMLGQRIRRTWYERWVRNPAWIVPRMEMPAVQIPIRGVLHGNLDNQLAAVWNILNEPGFSPPEPHPIRVIRRTGAKGSSEPAVVMTDNLETPAANFVKPLLVALPNRHNVLFDQQTQRLAGWWIGDAARQRTRGKYWYWESAGVTLVAPREASPELTLVWKGSSLVPEIDAALPPAFDFFEHTGGGIRFRTRLHYAMEGEAETLRQLRVTQVFAPIESHRQSSGFRRTIGIAGIPAGATVALRVLPEQTAASLSNDGRTAHALEGGNLRVSLVSPGTNFLGTPLHVELSPSPQGAAEVVLDYLTDLPVDQYLHPEQEIEPLPPTPLETVPGFECVRLPLPEEIMPIGLGWRSDGRLLITSLKNRVWQAEDTDGDGWEDRAITLGDELVQPYGVAAVHLAGGREAIDIVDKTGLLRLDDADGDGFFERTETLAAGWGHSTDYHGWAVGLPRDEERNYYVAISQRRGPDSHLRGRVLRLAPRDPTAENPRRYRIEPLTAGHRYPAGIARNRAGELFVTDNQGEYNPFNELNHVASGMHYGYVSPQDPADITAMPRQGPAVAIPHPWTRSVNGICFLETPHDVRQRIGRDLFGPFEGHVLGCEYDSRQLVRISLHKVGERWEGAVYPFSISTPNGGETFLGPVVCQVAPDGDIYVGGIRDSAYGAGRNTGEVVCLRINDRVPRGIAEMRSTSKGFEITFTRPVDPIKAADASNYALSSYRRIPTPAYGGPDQDRRDENIVVVDTAADGRGMTLRLNEIRPGHVYELRVKNLTRDGSEFHPAEAHYSLGRPISQ